MPDFLIVCTSAACLIWFWLLLSHHGFWRADQRLQSGLADQSIWPSVVAVIPARNEEDVIAATMTSLAKQEYPGAFEILLIDDHSDDGTADTAGSAVDSDRLKVLDAPPLPQGWTGKLAAMNHGVEQARALLPEHSYVLFTDADIAHPPDAVRRLVRKAQVENKNLVSLMVRLHCESFWERLLIPAFAFFFQKLFPFPAVNDDRSPIAAAAGGVMLVRRSALEAAGGLSAIHDNLIDDCALAALIKSSGGAIWLGVADHAYSVRPYAGLPDIWHMVARTAYTQLDYAPLKLLGAILSMALLYLAGPLIFILAPVHDCATASSLGLLVWILMACAYAPTIIYYRQPVLLTASLPLAGFLYTLMTFDSARRHWQKKGGLWKGRTY